ncbi:hypothetical protein Nmel_003061 [Mimus melanotis]
MGQNSTGKWGQSLPPSTALFCTSLKGGTHANSALSFQRVDAASFFSGQDSQSPAGCVSLLVPTCTAE